MDARPYVCPTSAVSPLDLRRIVRLFTPNAPLPCTNNMNNPTGPGRPSAARAPASFATSPVDLISRAGGRCPTAYLSPSSKALRGAGKLL